MGQTKRVPASADSIQRVAIYARVSTGRQAEHDLSIPDQVAQARAWCEVRRHVIAFEFIEAGASATSDKRPEFQRMIARACDADRAIDVIVVHSYSRFFRDAFEMEFYIRKLKRHGVAVISITQELGDDPSQILMRNVIALFDEYQSKENAKHVMRAMKENARQGFWNGSSPPYGYRTVEAEKRGARVKKKLAVDPVEAENVRLVFDLYLRGSDGSGPLGVKAIVVWLNQKGYRTRGGALWGVSPLHRMLKAEVYAGRLVFNRKAGQTNANKDTDKQVVTEVPAIVPSETFETVQRLLHLKNPAVTPPRVNSDNDLLREMMTFVANRMMDLDVESPRRDEAFQPGCRPSLACTHWHSHGDRVRARSGQRPGFVRVQGSWQRS